MKFIVICVVLLCATFSLNAADAISQADSLFSLRDKNFDIDRLIADTTDVNAAMSLYASVLKNDSDRSRRTEALWKLLQAYYFKGQFLRLYPA